MKIINPITVTLCFEEEVQSRTPFLLLRITDFSFWNGKSRKKLKIEVQSPAFFISIFGKILIVVDLKYTYAAG